jgi:hypothetical protein
MIRFLYVDQFSPMYLFVHYQADNLVFFFSKCQAIEE